MTVNSEFRCIIEAQVGKEVEQLLERALFVIRDSAENSDQDMILDSMDLHEAVGEVLSIMQCEHRERVTEL